MQNMAKLFTFILAIFLTACGSGSDTGTSVTQANATVESPSVFSNWDFLVPDSFPVFGIVSSNAVYSGMEQNYLDIIVGRRLNLSGMSYGENYIFYVTKPNRCRNSAGQYTLASKAHFILAIYSSGQMKALVRETCGTSVISVIAETTEYFKYRIENSKLIVCAYDDENYTLEAGCASSI